MRRGRRRTSTDVSAARVSRVILGQIFLELHVRIMLIRAEGRSSVVFVARYFICSSRRVYVCTRARSQNPRNFSCAADMGAHLVRTAAFNAFNPFEQIARGAL